MRISPDEWVFWKWGLFELNATILFTWGIMALLVLGSRAVTSRLSDRERPSRWQNFLEVIVNTIRSQIEDMGTREARKYLPFIGTLFVYIATANLLTVFPAYEPPTGSISTTTALAMCVFIAVPMFAIAERGIAGYLKNYIRPTVFMLPFNIIGEISRTIALAVRLYGNVMSSAVIIGILIGIAPFFFPVVMRVLGLVTGLIQAYIFAVLAMVYIASATRTHPGSRNEQEGRGRSGRGAPSS